MRGMKLKRTFLLSFSTNMLRFGARRGSSEAGGGSVVLMIVISTDSS